MGIKFLNVDLVDWVSGTIRKVQMGFSWNEAWEATYFEIGGKSESTSKKACPKNASRVLYQTGRLKDSGVEFKNVDLDTVWLDSKNGVYALLAVELLSKNHSMDYSQLKEAVYSKTVSLFGSAPDSDQGAIRMVDILWKQGRLQW